MKLLFISLGCDKNLVDSEFMIGMLANEGIELTDDENEADIIIVNSCCFIGDAKSLPKFAHRLKDIQHRLFQANSTL